MLMELLRHKHLHDASEVFDCEECGAEYCVFAYPSDRQAWGGVLLPALQFEIQHAESRNLS